MKYTEYSYLVVDDDKFIRDLISTGLHKKGATHVKTADDGTTALNYLKTVGAPPDIIICDLNMPEMEGIEVLRHLAAECFSGGIILTSGSNIAMLKTAMNLGEAQMLHMLGCLPKPFTLDDLLLLVSKYDRRPPMHVWQANHE